MLISSNKSASDTADTVQSLNIIRIKNLIAGYAAESAGEAVSGFSLDKHYSELEAVVSESFLNKSDALIFDAHADFRTELSQYRDMLHVRALDIFRESMGRIMRRLFRSLIKEHAMYAGLRAENTDMLSALVDKTCELHLNVNPQADPRGVRTEHAACAVRIYASSKPFEAVKAAKALSGDEEMFAVISKEAESAAFESLSASNFANRSEDEILSAAKQAGFTEEFIKSLKNSLSSASSLKKINYKKQETAALVEVIQKMSALMKQGAPFSELSAAAAGTNSRIKETAELILSAVSVEKTDDIFRIYAVLLNSDDAFDFIAKAHALIVSAEDMLDMAAFFGLANSSRLYIKEKSDILLKKKKLSRSAVRKLMETGFEELELLSV